MKLGIAISIALVILCAVGVVVLLQSPLGDVARWIWDDFRGYQFVFPAERCGNYTVALGQEPGSDFYDSYFQIVAADGRSTRLVVDGDDIRWRNPRRVEQNGRIYYLTGSDRIDDSTSYIDLTEGVLYAGYFKRRLNIDDVDPGQPYQ
jgi:hypothetical protein